jgi:hypothetical protein
MDKNLISEEIDIGCVSLEELRLVPFGCEDAPPSDGFESNSHSSNASKQVDKPERRLAISRFEA